VLFGLSGELDLILAGLSVRVESRKSGLELNRAWNQNRSAEQGLI